MADTLDALRQKVSLSCNILGNELQEDTGHVSARIPGTDEMYLRCRDGRGYGLLGTQTNLIRRVDFDGKGDDLGSEYAAPNESPLHGEIYRAKPDVGAVVHVHPFYLLLCGITGVEFKPVIGGYRPPTARIAIEGVPVFNRAATVTSKELALQMIEQMGDRNLILLRGHGAAVVGKSVEEATSLAIEFERLAKIMYLATVTGRPLIELAPEDVARYDPGNPDRQPFKRERRQSDELAAAADRGGWTRYISNLERAGVR